MKGMLKSEDWARNSILTFFEQLVVDKAIIVGQFIFKFSGKYRLCAFAESCTYKFYTVYFGSCPIGYIDYAKLTANNIVLEYVGEGGVTCTAIFYSIRSMLDWCKSCKVKVYHKPQFPKLLFYKIVA